MKNKKRYLIIAFIALVAIATYFYFSNTNDDNLFSTISASRNNITQEITATGEVTATQLVTVGSQASGQIEKIYITLGQTVKKGEIIAEIDATTQQNLYDTELAKLTSYKSQLSAAETALKIAKTQYEREVSLTSLQARAKSNLEDAEQTYSSAESRIVELQALIQQTEISLNTAKVNLAYTKILSPLDGTIVSIPVEEGQTVNASMSTPIIAQIADLTNMTILMEISEGDINSVIPGMEVTYSILSTPDEKYSATLKSIDPGLTTLSNGTYEKGTSSEKAIYYYGRVEVPNEELKLRIGMTTENNIEIAKAEDVITVPISAVKTIDGRKIVNILLENKPVQKKVITGISDGLNIEIKEGIKENDLIILEANDTQKRLPSQQPKPRMI